RLTDPERSFKNENASIKSVVVKAAPSLSAATRAQIDDLISALDRHVKNVRTHRDKALAHSDLSHALKVAVLPSVTYDELESAMCTLQEIVRKIASEVFGWTTHYDVIVPFG